MPRTAITPQKVTSVGVAPATEPANVAGNSIKLAPGRMVEVVNGSGSTVTVTVPTPATTVDGLAISDRTYSVPAAGQRRFALGTNPIYKQPGGLAFIDYSAVTSVTVAVFDVP